MPKPDSLNQHIKEWIAFYEYDGRSHLPFKISQQQSAPVVVEYKKYKPIVQKQLKPVETKSEPKKEIIEPKQETSFVEDVTMRSFFSSHFPNLPHLPFHAPIVLLHPPMDENEKNFLSKLRVAISNHIMTAELQPFSQEIFSSKTPRLLAAPIELLQKAFPQYSFVVHKVIEKAPSILPLSSLKQYTRDIDQKRDLWKILTTHQLRSLLKLS
jgi:hypothetical protein